MKLFPIYALVGAAMGAALIVPAVAQTPPAPAPAGTEAAKPTESGDRGFRHHHGERGPRGMRDHRGPMGPMGPMGMMDMMLPLIFDADGDGEVTQAELDSGLAALVAKYDADGNGLLSLDEYAGLHAELMRPMTVRAFQWFDTDGDGQLSAAEQNRAKDQIGKRLPDEATRDAAE